MTRTAFALLALLLAAPAVAQEEPPMTYDQFTQEFVTRAQAALTTTRNTLVTSGVSAGQVSVTVPDTTNLRVVLSATRSGRTCTIFFELTPVGVIDGQMSVIITLFVEGNGSEITHGYATGTPLKAFTQITELLAKLSEAETTTTGEVTVKARAFLRV